MKKALMICISLALSLALICVPIGASGGAKASGKIEYSGLISRMDKFLKYSGTDDNNKIYYYTRKGVPSNPFCWFDKYFWYNHLSELSSYDQKADFEQFLTAAQNTGMPQIYYSIKYSGITKQETENALKAYCDKEGMEYADWAIEALWSNEPLVVIETLLSPEVIIDMDVYNSGEPKVQRAGVEIFTTTPWYTYCIYTPNTLLKISLETLEGWGYSDAYWLDYYSFIQYLNSDAVQNDPIYGLAENTITQDANLYEDGALAELDRRVELYANRVANAETGDDNGTRVVFLASAAVICAVIPAMVAVKRRRREE